MMSLTIAVAAFLLALCVVPARAGNWQPKDGPLKTRWAAEVAAESPHPEYPRPQMRRAEWRSLNGVWSVALQREGAYRAPQPILVPFPIESALSGVMERAERVRYTRAFDVPKEWAGKRILLHFEAVDWEATVSVNGKALGTHRGGFDPFSFDVTDALKPSGPQTLQVDVFDPTDSGDQARGKQHRNPHAIWYTPATGIWASVWLEPVPASSISRVLTIPDVDAAALLLTVDADGPNRDLTVHAAAYEGNRKVADISGAPGKALALPIPRPRLWSPASPYLYRLKVWLKDGARTVDAVDSYFGMRKIAVGKDAAGVTRLLLNDEPLFQVGPLDQGYWPDGIYTPPTEEAMKYDIKAARSLGFNTIRKHVKVEPRRWYYWTDKLGMLVWQDMPSANNETDAGKKQFEVELQRVIHTLQSHPSIIMWVPFNEGWGQFDTERITAAVKEQDPSRLVNNASGWVDMKVGDVHDWHNYPMPIAESPEPKRASVVGEFGGYGLPAPGHMWTAENWGYRNLDTARRLGREYQRVFRRVWEMKDDPGISAAIYTQITDVEIETNGLLTYDRAMLKAPRSAIVAANTNHMPPPAIPETIVPSASDGVNVPWRYTMDRPAEGWWKPDFDDSGWMHGTAGFGTEQTPGGHISTVWHTPDIWLRRTFTLPSPIPEDLQLWIHHDEDAEVYLNGVEAFRFKGFLSEYEEHPLTDEARAALRPGENTIAVHAHNTEGGQYIDAGFVRMRTK